MGGRGKYGARYVAADATPRQGVLTTQNVLLGFRKTGSFIV